MMQMSHAKLCALVTDKIMASIWVLPVIASILIFALVLSQNTEALKSEGNSLTEVSSKQVCGTSLCDEPLSIAEKIRLYLQQLSGSESTVLQQAIDPRLMDPLKVKPGTMPLREALSAKQLEQAKVREVIPTIPQRVPITQVQFQVEGELPIDPILALQEENRLLKEKIIELEKIIDDLNQITMEQLEQAKVREFSTIPQKVPSTQSSIGVGIPETTGVPCLGCITAAQIAADAVGASEITSNAVGASEITSNAVGASEIGSNAVGKSELNMSIKSFTATNNGGVYTMVTTMVPNNGNNFCFLVKVKMENIDNSIQIDPFKIIVATLKVGVSFIPLLGETAALAGAAEIISSNIGKEIAECDIDYGSLTNWVLQANLGAPGKDANVSCQALCISYP